MNMTENQLKILKAIQPGTWKRGIGAKSIAWTLWGHNPKYEYLFGTKKAWLCAGSQVGKLRKAGLVSYDRRCVGYLLTKEGEVVLKGNFND